MATPPPRPGVLDQLTEWLHGPARAAPSLQDLCGAVLHALREAAVPVDRLNLGVFLLHPELAGVAHQVSPGGTVAAVEVTHEALRSPAYLDSPIRASVEDRKTRRFRLEPGEPLAFPFLEELREAGFTDYLLVPMTGTLRRVHVLSIATRAVGGLSDQVVEDVAAFCSPFGLLVDSLTTLALSEVLLRLYVGNQTGPRVLQGEVRLGRGQSIHAAILYSDLRGFSNLCSVQGTEATIDILNVYFDIVSRAVHAGSGEVLKLMGDAILAVFPVHEAGGADEQRAARACLEAARTARAELEQARMTGAIASVRAGFGLTLGEVVYGNIGAPGRLDFTIIGEAVNLAARLEERSKHVGEDVLLGPRIASRAGALDRPLGPTRIRGFSDPVALYGLGEPR